MSDARQCDLCGKLFQPLPGAVSIGEISVLTKSKKGLSDTWSEIDFCAPCSKTILKLIGPALDGLRLTT